VTGPREERWRRKSEHGDKWNALRINPGLRAWRKKDGP
jgi:hypothetical protein